MTKNQAIEKLLNSARADIGYHEGTNNYTKYAETQWDNKFYGWELQHQPWCDVFVDYHFTTVFGMNTGAAMTYQVVGKGSALCSASAQFFKNNKAFYDYPEPGDQIFFKNSKGINHTGIVESVVGLGGTDWSGFTSIEGNSSDRVERRYYTRDKVSVAGFGRPKWELVVDEKEPEDTIVVDRLLYIGTSGQDVVQLQKQLILLGYSCGSCGADGQFGKATQAAVIKFQKANGLVADGVVGPKTRSCINSKLSINDNFKVGDVIEFLGVIHYTNAFATTGSSCRPGPASITAIATGSNVKHPYHVVHTNSVSSVYGWVNKTDIEPKRT